MRKFLIAILLIAGLGVLFYPSISSYLNDIHSSYILEDYDSDVASMSSTEILQEKERARQYNQALTSAQIQDPFSEKQENPSEEDVYYQLLNVNGVMGSVEIPSINVNLPIYHGTSDYVLNRGIGHLKGSSLPIGGVGSHAVLTGHTGLSSAKYFTDLTDLKENDFFYIHVLDEILVYKVDQIKVVTPDNVEDLQIDPQQDYVTLLTCTPYGINSHRLLVRGVRTDYDPNVNKDVGTTNQLYRIFFILFMITLVICIILAILLYVTKRKQKRNEGS